MTQPDIRKTSFLGIECGGTRTVAIQLSGQEMQRKEFGPANLKLLNDPQLVLHFRSIANSLPAPDALGIGMAGARTESDRNRIRTAAGQVWRGTPCAATNDLETALESVHAVAGVDVTSCGSKEPDNSRVPRVLVLSGTGSCCFGRAPDGRSARMGGWGHLLGDKGSGYEIGLRALKASVFYWDRDGQWSLLGRRILRALQLNQPDDLIAWAQQAGKNAIASLALEVFAAASQRDAIARDILEGARRSLARDALACAKKLAQPGKPVLFVLAGGVLLNQTGFSRKLAALLLQSWPGAKVIPLPCEGAWGAVALARKIHQAAPGSGASPEKSKTKPPAIRKGKAKTPALSAAISPTEQRHPNSWNLDQLPLPEAIELLICAEAKIPAALLAESASIERALRRIIRSFRQGGRLFYAGAGTSGRLGVLDASECPPTFRSPPDQVQGIIAGGQEALWKAVEGAEDDPEAGRHAVVFRGINAKDVLVGIAASGRTPFVWGALEEARRRHAVTVLICFNPNLRIPRGKKPNVIICPDTGPEILTGSTRLKAGTATKILLNVLTTLAMVRTGKVISNLMVDLNPSNTKLRDRAVRIVHELTGATSEEAEAALINSGWMVKEALKKLGKTSDRESRPEI
jgi:N-acetylmuramic acid 6-phosphate etherase